MKCPKCGSEMKEQVYITEEDAAKGIDWTNPRRRFICQCGHEEKLKDGEKED